MKFLSLLVGALALCQVSAAPAHIKRAQPTDLAEAPVANPIPFANLPYAFGKQPPVPRPTYPSGKPVPVPTKPVPSPTKTSTPPTTTSVITKPTESPQTCKAKLELLFKEEHSLSLDIKLRIVDFIKAVKAIKIDFEFEKFFELIVKKEFKGDETDIEVVLSIFKELKVEIDLPQAKKLLGILIVSADIKQQLHVLFEIRQTLISCGIQTGWKFILDIYTKVIFDLELAIQWFHNECGKFNKLFAIDIEAFFKLVLEIKADFNFHDFFARLIIKKEITFAIIIETFKECGITQELHVRQILIKLAGDIDLAVSIFGKLVASIKAVGIDVFLKIHQRFAFKLQVAVKEVVQWFHSVHSGIQLQAFIVYCQSLKFDFDVKLFLEKMLQHKGVFDEVALLKIFVELGIHIDVSILRKIVVVLNKGQFDLDIFGKWVFIFNWIDKVDDFFGVWVSGIEKFVLKVGTLVDVTVDNFKSILVELPLALSIQLKKWHFAEFVLEIRKLHPGFDLRIFFENWKKIEHRFDFGAFHNLLKLTLGIEIDIDISVRLFEVLCGGKNYDIKNVVANFELIRKGFNKPLNKNYNFAKQLGF
ncbi:hypothetical protein SpCBS45565_g01482 [Spizellomyces sp. 'palustris']|nr:hypothetical protein SpCBS45565_g01482 [Spizellomyces sp. 'palustris']